eukprot:g82717.t1
MSLQMTRRTRDTLGYISTYIPLLDEHGKQGQSCQSFATKFPFCCLFYPHLWQSPQSVSSNNMIERNLGEQPLAEILAQRDLKPHALVEASTEQLTHTNVSSGCKGRRLTPNMKGKILRALNAATGETFAMGDLFNY